MDAERLQVIDEANKSFGESGWSFSISNVALDFIDGSQSGIFSAGASVVVRVQRSNGIFREDVGYGSSTGMIKSEVISKAKKDAVTDGLKGAMINFGGDIARKFDNFTPRKSVKSKQETSTIHESASKNASNAATSPFQAAVKPVSTNVPGNKTSSNSHRAQMMPSVSSTSPLNAKSDPARVTSVPTCSSSPLAKPLKQHPQQAAVSTTALSEEDMAKAERKKRQRLLQEEFRKRHLLEQAQSKAQEKGAPKIAAQQSREPLKEQQVTKQHPRTSNANVIDGDDEVLLSTQDIEAISAIAANNSVSRHVPMISSPSIAREYDVNKNQSKQPTGHKRPDLSNYAFNPEKKPKGV